MTFLIVTHDNGFRGIESKEWLQSFVKEIENKEGDIEITIEQDEY